MLVWEHILLFNRSDLFEIYFGTEHRGEYGRFTCPHNKGSAPQRLHYCTTKHRYLIYNCKYKQVHQCGKGASENSLLMYTLYCFPAKRGLKRPENSQYLPKLVVKVQNFFILIHESQKFFVKFNQTACYFIVLGCPLYLYYSYDAIFSKIPSS